MKPFDLEAAKRGEPVQTRNGLKARLIAQVDEIQTLLFLIEKTVCSYQLNGRMHGADLQQYADCEFYTRNDLFMAPRKRHGWVGIYKIGQSNKSSYHIYETAEEAKKTAGPFANPPIACVQIEWNE